MAERGEELLKKPLYVFDLPPEILATLERKVDGDARLPRIVEDASEERVSTGTEDDKDGVPAKATSCALCGLVFSNVLEQRSHIRSDLHGYNLKQKIKGLKPVNEAEFDKLVGDLDESISGSESSASSSEDEEASANGVAQNDTILSSLLKKQAKLAQTGNEDIPLKGRNRGTGKAPLIWFKTRALPDNTSLGVYRAIFTNSELEAEQQIVQTIRHKQLSTAAPPKSTPEDLGGVPLVATTASPHIFLCMIGGGHFAAMVVSLAPKVSKKHTSAADERSATVLAHKTFHRYTTRRKQGGSQSANDATKGAAHSAGSSLRRYNEAALTNEIRDLLSQWKEMIESSELLFVRATGSTNRRTLFGPYDGQVIRHNDPRIRGFPFSTRRATQAELMRCFVELTRVKVSQVDEAALAAAEAEAASASAEKPARRDNAPSSPKPKPNKENEVAALHTTQIQALIRRSKAPALLSYLSQNTLSADFRFYSPDAQSNHHAPTPLHLAASANTPACVLALLTRAGADPRTLNGEGKPPFDLAGDRATRDAFRLARHTLGESRWDWDSAHVPSPLTKAEADQRESRDKQDSAAAEEDRRKAEMEKLKAEEMRKEDDRRKNKDERRDKRHGTGKVLSVEKTAQERREEEARGMTPEMRMRLERERRARAAEERVRRMQGAGRGAGGGGAG